MPEPTTDGASSAPAAPSLESLTPSQYLAWRMTGDLPTNGHDPETPDAASSPAPTPVADPSPAAPDDQAPKPSSPADPPLAASTAKDMQRLLADRVRERERADRAERRLADLERAQQTPPPTRQDARPAVSSTAPVAAPKPNINDFQDYSDYVEALADWKAEQKGEALWQRLEARQAAAREEAEQAASRQRLAESWQTRVTAAKARHADFETVAFQQPTEIPEGSTPDAYILEMEDGADVLYHLQQNPTELQRILGLRLSNGQPDGAKQLRELVLLGARLTADPSIPSSTKAPPPPPTLGTRASPTDPADRAMAEDDFVAYKNAMNKRDLAARK